MIAHAVDRLLYPLVVPSSNFCGRTKFHFSHVLSAEDNTGFLKVSRLGRETDFIKRLKCFYVRKVSLDVHFRNLANAILPHSITSFKTARA